MLTSFFRSETVPVYPGWYEVVVSNGWIKAFQAAEGIICTDYFGPGSDFWKAFVVETSGELFVSVSVSRHPPLRLRSDFDPSDRDLVRAIGVGRFAEMPESMGAVFLQSFTIAEAMNLPDDGSGFRDVVYPGSDSKAVSLGELFCDSAGNPIGSTYFLYVGDAARKFLGEALSFPQQRWMTNPETVLRLLSRCGLTDVLSGNKSAQAHLAFIARQAEEELAVCAGQIGGLEEQLDPLKRQADALVEEIKFLRPFISK